MPKKEDFEIEKIHEEEEEYKGLDDFIPSKDNNFFEDKEKIFKLKKQFNPENEKTIYDRRNYKVSLDELRRFVGKFFNHFISISSFFFLKDA